MKRQVSIRVDVELSATHPTGIDEAAEEAIASIKCNLAFDKGRGEYLSATLIEKSFIQPDEHRLLEIVLHTCDISITDFIKSNEWRCARARNLFGFCARQYLEWSWNQIGDFLHRDRSTVIKGVGDMISLLSGVPRRKIPMKSDFKSRIKRSDDVKKRLFQIKFLWGQKK